MKRSIGSENPPRIVLRFFARYYDANEMIHLRIAWTKEISQNLAPHLGQKL